MPGTEPPSLIFRSPAALKGRRRQLAAFAGELSAHVAGGRTFACLFTGDEEIRRLNRRFRRHDAPTDVLSFPSGDAPGGALGDIAISVDYAARQARALGHPRYEEVRVLMLHGVLHLLGLDHESADGGRMRRVERLWRRRLGLTPGLIERARA